VAAERVALRPVSNGFPIRVSEAEDIKPERNEKERVESHHRAAVKIDISYGSSNTKFQLRCGSSHRENMVGDQLAERRGEKEPLVVVCI
jgi:hypothetical protein